MIEVSPESPLTICKRVFGAKQGRKNGRRRTAGNDCAAQTVDLEFLNTISRANRDLGHRKTAAEEEEEANHP